MPAGVSKELVASTPVEVSSTSTPSSVSSMKLVASAPVEVSATFESGVEGVAAASGGDGGKGAGGVGLDPQKKFLEPRALKSRPRVEQVG